MRHSLGAILLTTLAALATSCGGRGPGEQPVAESFRGQWSYVKYWNEGSDQGPSFHGDMSLGETTLSITDGESSKDSGSWTIEGRYAVVSGSGSRADPYLLDLRVDRARGEERHPAPVESGDAVELRVYIAGDELRVTFPGQDLTFSRKAAP